MSGIVNKGCLPFTKVSGRILNGTRLFGSFQQKSSGSNGTSNKVVLFFRAECSKRKSVFHFFNTIFDTSFRPSRSFFANGTVFYRVFQKFVPIVNCI